MDGWILLYKKLWDSPHFQGKKNRSSLLLVWVWLLTHCDREGVVTCGRYQISKDTGLSASSVARILSNFFAKANSLVNYEANSVFTKITILKYPQLQRKVNKEVNKEVNSNRTASEQQVNTNKELRIKNKEYISENLEKFEKDFPSIDVSFEWNKCLDYYASRGKDWKDWGAVFRNWLRSEFPKKKKQGVARET